jgi:hypothetical protein
MDDHAEPFGTFLFSELQCMMKQVKGDRQLSWFFVIDALFGIPYYRTLLLPIVESVVLTTFFDLTFPYQRQLFYLSRKWKKFLPPPLFTSLQEKMSICLEGKVEKKTRKRKGTEPSKKEEIFAIIHQLEKEGFYVPRIQEVCQKLREKVERGQNIHADLKNLLNVLKTHPQPNYIVLLNLLYRDKQCSLCGQRFEKAAYAAHLDEEFRTNCQLAERKSKNLDSHRQFFPTADEWADPSKEQIVSSTPDIVGTMGTEGTPGEVEKKKRKKICCLVKDAEPSICVICQEPLQPVWQEDQDAWMYDSVLRVGDQQKEYASIYGPIEEGENSLWKKNVEYHFKGQLIHQACYEIKIKVDNQ